MTDYRNEAFPTELDRSVIDKLAAPLTHLVRNAIDHGIESAEQRLAAGKPAEGRLSLNAYHDSGMIVIEVEDDGRGIPVDRHPQYEDLTAAEVVLTVLHAGGELGAGGGEHQEIIKK